VNLDFRVIDSLQFRFSQMEDRIARMQARISALESGQPLPADQLIEVAAPVIHYEAPPEPSVEQAPLPAPSAPPQVIEYSEGMLMPTGARR